MDSEHIDAELVRALDTEVYTVPTDQPEGDGTLAWSATTLVVVRVRSGGVEGLGWTYTGAAAKGVVDDRLAGIVVGSDPLDVPGTHESMASSVRNDGRPGMASCAISAVDIALWDLKARLLGLPLARLWGRARHDVPLYGSGGFTTYDDRTTRQQVEGWLQRGMSRVKIKIGESWGADTGRDLQRVGLVRRVVGDDVEVFVDANGAYTRKQAVRMGRRMAAGYGVVWFEEPVSSDDRAGLREVRDACEVDVAAGEYGYMPAYFASLIADGAVDCVQADVTRCGGFTDWLRVAGLAAAHNLQISGHCAPNLHAHVAVACPNLAHVEYFHDHVRIEQLLFDGALEAGGGVLVPGSEPGHGLVLKAADAAGYRTA
ncbi:MAG: mandelate racemase [Actinomycetota bacterium]|jgi:L-alanine-DL-glutamate epimerase-like enolase superfamily enzyme|nr:mandelate racemase [Actinomycetota bacterium]